MRNEYDFSKGRQGRFAGLKLDVVGDKSIAKQNPATVLAVCLDNDDFNLIIGKIYQVKVLDDSKFSVIDEKGKVVICTSGYFLPVDFEPKIAGQLRKLLSY